MIEVKPMGPTIGGESCNGCYSINAMLAVSVGRGDNPNQTMTVRLCEYCAAVLVQETQYHLT